MAEGGSSQNQGQQPQNVQPKEVKNEVLDQKKADRADKERERRRRRRRKKAELKKLQRETLQGQAQFPQKEQLPPAEPKIEPTSKLQPLTKEVPKPETKLKETPQPPVLQPKKPRPPRQPKSVSREPHIVERSDEHAPRSKRDLPKGEPGKPESEKQEPVKTGAEKPQPEVSKEKEHPLTHKTHSFTGPLIEKKPEPVAAKEEEPETVKEEPVAEPVSLEPEPEPQEAEVTVEPAPEPEREVEAKVAPEPEQPLAKPQEAEEIVISNGREERRPKVGMQEVKAEDEVPAVPAIFPYPQEEEKLEAEEKRPQKVEIVKKEPKHPKEEKKTLEKEESTKETLSESEGLNERKSLLQGAGGFSAGVLKNIGNGLRGIGSKISLKGVIGFLVLVIVGGGVYAGYLFKLHEKAYDFVTGLFKAPPPVEVNLDEKLLREWGITTALLFGDNRGSTRDLLASQLYNAYFFGYLAEPRVEGETGITPAYFYGTGADLDAAKNRFIGYVKNLRELVSVYDVDVYAMLDEVTDREKALNDYLAKLNDIMEKSANIVKEISVEVDDLKVSYESLNPERTRFETDFFVALQGLAGEKSDFLLKSFIDVSQKQSAIKAHVAALEKLLTYYDTSMKRLAIRITSIGKNHQALVQGIKVVDIPGANLDIIIRENP